MLKLIVTHSDKYVENLQVRPTHCSVAVMSNSLRQLMTVAHQVLCAWNFEEYFRAGCHFLLHGIFPTQEMEPASLASPCIGGRILFITPHLGRPLHTEIGHNTRVHVQQNAQKYKQICNKAHRESKAQGGYPCGSNVLFQQEPHLSIKPTSQVHIPRPLLFGKDLKHSPFPLKYAQPISLPLRLRKSPERHKNPMSDHQMPASVSCSHKSQTVGCWALKIWSWINF